MYNYSIEYTDTMLFCIVQYTKKDLYNKKGILSLKSIAFFVYDILTLIQPVLKARQWFILFILFIEGSPTSIIII